MSNLDSTLDHGKVVETYLSSCSIAHCEPDATTTTSLLGALRKQTNLEAPTQPHRRCAPQLAAASRGTMKEALEHGLKAQSLQVYSLVIHQRQIAYLNTW